MPVRFVVGCFAAIALLSAGVVHAGPEELSECEHYLVKTGTMRAVISNIGGYDKTLTTNYSRFVADFLLGLAAHPDLPRQRQSFQIQPERFMSAWRSATGRKTDEAPVSMRRVLEYGQRFAVDTAPDLDLEDREAGSALAVRVSWPEDAGLDNSYTYEDTLSDPDVRIRQARVIRYLLIDFGDVVAYERMSGVSGRPTSGALGALFSMLGMADIESTRQAIAADGTQVNRTRVRKLFPFTALATVTPDGTARRGVPDGRDDLELLADKLEFDLDLRIESPWPRPCH